MAEHTFVIAEAGVNHNGSLDSALRLIDVAADAGADAVKFQTFKSSELVTRKAERARYQIENLGETGSQLAMLQRLELPLEAHERMVAHCADRGVRFMSTAFDLDSLAFLSRFDLPALKIPSGDVTAAPMLLAAARLLKPMIVSTGMCTLGDIEAALGVLAYGLTSTAVPSGRADFEAAYFDPAGRQALRDHITLLHCVTQYPAAPASVNLRAMDTMRAAFGLPVGYSDHTLGIEVSIAAVARGAIVIEKHFTLDRGMAGPDHAASLEPGELARMIAAIRNVELALGTPAKQPAPEELANRPVARRSVVAARPLKAGQRLGLEDLTCKRPADGISAIELYDLVGRIAHRDYDVDDPIEP